MAFNLIRSSRVFFTTNVDTYGYVHSDNGNVTPAFTTTNTREIQVLAGFSFSQTTATETVTLSEAGPTPNRGQRNYNTALNPVDFSFTTYMRPRDAGGTVDAEEGALWNAMFGYDPIGTALTAAWVPASGSAVCSTGNSNKHQLQPFGLVICLDDATFVIDNCVMDQAVIDFGLDAIASIAWTGKGAALRRLTTKVTLGTVTGAAGTLQTQPFTGGSWTNPLTGASITNTAGAAAYKHTAAPYLANKLSTVVFDKEVGAGSGTSYTIPITGGSLTFANNVTYLTPANLGVVNTPITYFTGTRAISGSINAYLRTGTGSSPLYTADLLTAMFADSANTSPVYSMRISIGGSTSATTRVDIELPAIMPSFPTIATEQVISTTIGFTAQGYTGSAFDIEKANEATITYYAAESTAVNN
jgi:hypothetical protein